MSLINISQLTFAYDGSYDNIFENVSFQIDTDWKLGFTGRNGCGKSSILKLLLGQNVPYQGTARLGSKLIVSYIPQDASFLSGGLKKFAQNNRLDETLFKTILRKLDFSRIQFAKDMRDFSGGQKKKVLLAKSLCQEAHLYVWDEPFNFIDVLSRIQIEHLILQHQPTMLFVEHDISFVNTVATKQIDF